MPPQVGRSAGEAGNVGDLLLPKPAEMKLAAGGANAGAFQLASATVILHDKDTAELATMLQKDIADQTGLELKLATETFDGA